MAPHTPQRSERPGQAVALLDLGWWYRVCTTAAVLGALAALAAGCATMQSQPGSATAEIKNARGQVVGNATLIEVSGGVRVVLDARGLPTGEKGVHIHEVGKCDPPRFESAGSHFNPDKRQHGLMNPAGPHAGDLPNIRIEAGGTGRLETTSNRIALTGGPNTIFDADGSALVIHGAADDHRTDPTGNSGNRIACGVLVRK